jgi:hypothetical protein
MPDALDVMMSVNMNVSLMPGGKGWVAISADWVSDMLSPVY